MGNRITRTVLFAASAFLSISAFGAGAARFGTLRNADWVVTNAWQAVSNKTHDLIIDLGQEASLPPDWQNVSNAAMNAVQTEVMTSFVGQSLRMFSQTNEVMSGGPYLSATGGTIIAKLSTPDAGLEVRTPGIPMLGSPPRATRMRADGFGVSNLAEDWLWLDSLGFRFERGGDDVRFNLPIGTTGGTLARLEDIDLTDATNYTNLVAAEFENGYRSAGWANNAGFANNADLAETAKYLGDGPSDEHAMSRSELIVASTNAANAVADAKISTNNAAFVSAVLAAPLVGADPDDLSELSEYGSYGTVGAALLALIAGLAALKRGKLDGAAAYPEWTENAPYLTVGTVVSYKGLLWRNTSPTYHHGLPPGREGSVWTSSGVNIKNLKQDVLTFDSAPTANSVNPVTSGGVYTALQGKANAADLPYALVTPGEWEFSDGQAHTVQGPHESRDTWAYSLDSTYSSREVFETEEAARSALSLAFMIDDSDDVVATRASLPGHLCDRAGNRVVVSGDTTLTIPELAEQGKLRDFLVRLEIGGSTVPTITFAAPTGETVTYETDGDEFPVPDEAGTWLYSFTETAAHKFAVSLKKVNTVTQGGS